MSNHVDTVYECDGQTDRITITKTVERIASHGRNPNALVTLVDIYSVCIVLLTTMPGIP